MMAIRAVVLVLRRPITHGLGLKWTPMQDGQWCRMQQHRQNANELRECLRVYGGTEECQWLLCSGIQAVQLAVRCPNQTWMIDKWTSERAKSSASVDD